MKEVKTFIKVKTFLLEYGWCIWTGIALSALFDVGVDNYKFYTFYIPLVVLVGISKNHNKKKDTPNEEIGGSNQKIGTTDFL